MLRKIPKHILYIFYTYVTGILFFALIRLILLISEYHRVSDIPGPHRLSTLLRSFLMGSRFDTVISGYILFIPLAVLSTAAYFNINQIKLYRYIFVFIYAAYSFAFMICCADISYFNFYFAHLSSALFSFADDAGTIFKMIIFDFKFWWVAIPFAIILVLFYRLMKRIYATLKEKPQYSFQSRAGYLTFTSILSIIALTILFIGIRGRIESKSPIRVGTAFFSSYPLANQLGLNPVFYLAHTWIMASRPENNSITFMDSRQAIENVQTYLNIPKNQHSPSPIARVLTPTGPALQSNVVVIIMESMSAAFLNRFGNTENLTPNLDRLARNGYSFDNIYTSGIHTYNGIYSVLCSYPSLKKQNPLKNMSMKKYSGFASTLKQRGFSTAYFMTHDNQFDNIEGFLRSNDVDRIISQNDYPRNKIIGTWGVSDDFMFDFSLPVLDDMAGKKKPFFAVMMTTSNHRPYILPSYFKPKTKDIGTQMVEYADWSLGKFIRSASEKEWFKNTLFVFVADHGTAVNPTYDMPLNFHHTPFIVYAPYLLKESRRFDCIGGQIDVFPTVMGLLNIPYVNNTFGIDLLKEKRPYIFFSEDDKYGALGDSFYLIVGEDGRSRLYKYRNKDLQDCALENKPEAERMRTYAESMFQTAQWIVGNHRY
ncbi:MAG: LTA synthase family protein [Candidatus Omnitrophota bacterium]